MIAVFLSIALIISFLALVLLIKKIFSLKGEISDLNFAKSSQSVKYGKTTEQWIPFSEQFPFPSDEFKFLGNPIDGIVFSDNEIVFCEFKSNKSQLSPKQKNIKQLVEAKKVRWLELFIK